MSLKPFEIEVIKHLVPAQYLETILSTDNKIKVKSTGHGYFLDFKHPKLSESRIVYSEPLVAGKFEDLELGFVIFVENSEFTLECHGYDKPIPANIRDCEVKINLA
ncbi:MAG: hypothetical protein COA79_12500 [Planctomycetota bacterium]|nr:MAG: hypothetical protein COA79_12500 [Planctomycetota bacterium]